MELIIRDSLGGARPKKLVAFVSKSMSFAHVDHHLPLAALITVGECNTQAFILRAL